MARVKGIKISVINWQGLGLQFYKGYWHKILLIIKVQIGTIISTRGPNIKIWPLWLKVSALHEMSLQLDFVGRGALDSIINVQHPSFWKLLRWLLPNVSLVSVSACPMSAINYLVIFAEVKRKLENKKLKQG